MDNFDITLNKYSFCLTCNIDRYNYLVNCFKSIGLTPPRIFPGIHHPYSGPEGCKLGHIGMIMLARCLGLPYIVVFEDDAYPRADVQEKFNEFIKELNETDPNWGMLVIGRTGEISCWDGNPEEFWGRYQTDQQRNSLKSKVNVISDNIISIPKNPNGSHAIVIRKNCYNEWLHSLVKNKYSDIALGQCNFSKNKVYWTKELLFCQKQIDKKCMTYLEDKKDNQDLFLYPYNYNKDFSGVVSIFSEPPKGFVRELVTK